MMANMMSNWQNFPDVPFGMAGLGWGTLGFILLLTWSLAWKGLALWRAAHKEEKVWFVVFLILNTIGILEILYLYVFSKEKKEAETETSQQAE